MTGLRAQAKQVVRALAKAYPDATCALTHQNAYQLIVATILSAQCTDERVNMVTPTLFAKYPDVRALAAADQAELEAIIRSTGFFRAKSTSLRGMAKAVVEDFGGEIPRTLDDLVTLPGVGRKTANVVLGTVWGIATGSRRRHARQTDHQSPRPDEEHQPRTDRARPDAAHPAIRVGRLLPPPDPPRPADLHRAGRSAPSVPYSVAANAWDCRRWDEWSLRGVRAAVFRPLGERE